MERSLTTFQQSNFYTFPLDHVIRQALLQVDALVDTTINPNKKRALEKSQEIFCTLLACHVRHNEQLLRGNISWLKFMNALKLVLSHPWNYQKTSKEVTRLMPDQAINLVHFLSMWEVKHLREHEATDSLVDTAIELVGRYGSNALSLENEVKTEPGFLEAEANLMGVCTLTLHTIGSPMSYWHNGLHGHSQRGSFLALSDTKKYICNVALTVLMEDGPEFCSNPVASSWRCGWLLP